MKKILMTLAFFVSIAASAQNTVGQLMFWGNGERLNAAAVTKLKQDHSELRQKLSELGANLKTPAIQSLMAEISRLYDGKNVYVSVSNARGSFSSVRLNVNVGRAVVIRRVSQLDQVYKSSEFKIENLDCSQSALGNMLAKIMNERREEVKKIEAKRKEDAQKAAIILMMMEENNK